MRELTLNTAAMAAMAAFCEDDTLENRIGLIDDLGGVLLDQLARTGDGEDDKRKRLADWMVALRDMRDDLRRIRRSLSR